jgi:hypothetical protein
MSRRRFKFSVCVVAIVFFATFTGRGAIPLDPPEAFFTNVAQRILMTMAADFAPVTNVNAIMVLPRAPMNFLRCSARFSEISGQQTSTSSVGRMTMTRGRSEIGSRKIRAACRS